MYMYVYMYIICIGIMYKASFMSFKVDLNVKFYVKNLKLFKLNFRKNKTKFY